MSSDTFLQFTEVGKSYPPQRTPLIQLWNQLRGHQGTAQGSFHALKPLSLQVNRGQSLGIVGLNGAGEILSMIHLDPDGIKLLDNVVALKEYLQPGHVAS